MNSSISSLSPRSSTTVCLMCGPARSDAPRRRSCLISKRGVARTLRVLPDSKGDDGEQKEAAVNEPTRQPHRSIFACITLVTLSAVGCASHGPLTPAKVAQAERAVEDAPQAGAPGRAPPACGPADAKLTAPPAWMA